MYKRLRVYIEVVLAAVLTAATPFLYGQSYTITPNDTIEAIAPLNDLKHYNILQLNNTGEKLVLSWQQLKLSIPKGWLANLCDNGHCYNDFPLSGTMDTVIGSDYGLMSVGIDPGTIPGNGIIQYMVWDINFPLKKDTLTWIITANKTSNLRVLEDDISFNVFPNPANTSLEITSDLSSVYKVIISDVLGKEIYSIISYKNSILVCTENFPNGLYNVSTWNKNKVIDSKKIAIQH
jgi:hypothetical protein